MRKPAALKVFGGALQSRQQGCQVRAVVMVPTWKALYEVVARAGFTETPKRLRGWWSETKNEVELEKAKQVGEGVLLISSFPVFSRHYRKVKKGAST